jgi:hypothetical protein
MKEEKEIHKQIYLPATVVRDQLTFGDVTWDRVAVRASTSAIFTAVVSLLSSRRNLKGKSPDHLQITVHSLIRPHSVHSHLPRSAVFALQLRQPWR